MKIPDFSDFEDMSEYLMPENMFRKYMNYLCQRIAERLMTDEVRTVSPVLCCYTFPEHLNADNDDPQINIAIDVGESGVTKKSMFDLGWGLFDKFGDIVTMMLIVHGEMLIESKSSEDDDIESEVISITGMTLDGRTSMGYVSAYRDESMKMIPTKSFVYNSDDIENAESPLLESVIRGYRASVKSKAMQIAITVGLSEVGLMKPPRIEPN